MVVATRHSNNALPPLITPFVVNNDIRLINALLPVAMIRILRVAATERRRRNGGNEPDLDVRGSLGHACSYRMTMMMMPASPSSTADILIAAATLPFWISVR